MPRLGYDDQEQYEAAFDYLDEEAPEGRRDQVCPHCNGLNIDTSGRDDGGCHHCFNGYVDRGYSGY